jgi:hypothetical protein
VRSRSLRTLALCLVTVVFPTGGPLRAAVVADFQAGTAYDDNLNRAQSDGRSDTALVFTGSAGARVQIGANGSVTFNGTLEGQSFDEIDGLNRISPGAAVSLRVKTRVGARVPWYQVILASAFQDFKDSAREGQFYQGRIRGGWFIGDRAGFTAEGAYSIRNASLAVFDQNAVSFSLGADLPVGEWGVIFGGYQVRRGDVVSSTPPDPEVLAEAKERAPDPVFGPSSVAYRLEATSHDLHVGINAALGRHLSAELILERLLALAGGGIDYRVNQARAGILYRH